MTLKVGFLVLFLFTREESFLLIKKGVCSTSSAIILEDYFIFEKRGNLALEEGGSKADESTP